MRKGYIIWAQVIGMRDTQKCRAQCGPRIKKLVKQKSINTQQRLLWPIAKDIWQCELGRGHLSGRVLCLFVNMSRSKEKH